MEVFRRHAIYSYILLYLFVTTYILLQHKFFYLFLQKKSFIIVWYHETLVYVRVLL